MNNKLDPELLKIPAFMRKKTIVSQAKQKLILTALDRKDAGLTPKSKKPLAPSKISARKITARKRPTLKYTASTRPQVNSLFSGMETQIEEQTELQDEPQTSIEETSQPSTPKQFQLIGETTHYLSNIDVAIIMLSAPLKIGEMILIEGDDTVFAQEVSEMQIDRKPVKRAKKGSHIGLKSAFPARVNGRVYRLSL